MPPVAVPNTPHSKARGDSHAQINDLIQKLNSHCGFTLPCRKQDWSPSTSSHSVSNSCVGRIKRLFFLSRQKLDWVLTEFKATRDRNLDEQTNLMRLNEMLDRALSSVTSSISKSNQSSSLGNEHPSRPIFATPGSVRQPAFHTGGQYTRSQRHGDKSRTDDLERFETAPESPGGSSTEVEDNDTSHGAQDPTAPQSPSLRAARAVDMRTGGADISPQYPDLSGHPARRSPAKKRLSDETHGSGPRDRSRKYSRTSHGRQANASAADLAADSYMDTSFTSATTSTAPTSMRASFASSVFPEQFQGYRNGTVTANTSFTSVGSPGNGPDEDLMSSATWGSTFDVDDAILNLSREDSAIDRTLTDLRLEKANPISAQAPPPMFNAPAAPANVSLSKRSEPYYVADIPHKGFFTTDPKGCGSISDYGSVPFIARWDLARLTELSDSRKNYDVVVPEYIAATNGKYTYSHFKDFMLARFPEAASILSEEAAWKDRDTYNGYTFKASWTYDIYDSEKKSNKAFKLNLEPATQDVSCRFQRSFGFDRFFFLTVPHFQSLPNHFKGQKDALYVRFKEFLRTDHTFLGRKWRAIYLDEKQVGRSRITNKRDVQRRVVLFATSGCDLSETRRILSEGARPPLGSKIDPYDLLNWFIPIRKNQQQRYCKAFARLALGLSRTVPTLVFKPSQIRRVKDTLANGEAEDTSFDGPERSFIVNTSHEDMIMNDGCARVSYAAGKRIWSMMNLDEPMPSAFQARLGGAKGMWFVDPPTQSEEIWIEVTDSQLKLEPHDMDLDDSTFDEMRLTFDVNSYSRPAARSSLHLAYLPILMDRKVRSEFIIAVMEISLNAERQNLLDILTDTKLAPQRLAKWLADRDISQQDPRAPLNWLADMPSSEVQKLYMLLDAGFRPNECKYLVEVLCKLHERNLMRMSQNLTLPIEKSCNVFGIADPTGTLKPGEIYLSFSRKFEDRITGELFPHLNGREVLVARHPCLRPSDIQKVRGIYPPELSHIHDVVVFSSRGTHALANKLQGGDYDGDTFWICWEEQFTQNFLNAPAPAKSADPADYNIEVDKASLETRFPNGSRQYKAFFQHSMDLLLEENLLGPVTIAWGKVCYNNGNIDSAPAQELCDLHDLLVDSAKNGYRFNYKKFDSVKQGLQEKGLLREQPYKKAMGAMGGTSFDTAIEAAKKLRPRRSRVSNSHDQLNLRGKPSQLKDINDFLFFDIVLPHHEETSRLLKEIAKETPRDDDHLTAPWNTFRLRMREHPDEIRNMEDKLRDLRTKWKQLMGIAGRKKDKGENIDDYPERVESTFAAYTDIQPLKPEHPDIRALVNPVLSNNTPDWEYLKASALYCGHLSRFGTGISEKKEDFPFLMAGSRLMAIKAVQSGQNRRDVRYVTQSMRASLKPKKINIREPSHTAVDGLLLAAGEEDIHEDDDERRSHVDYFDG